MCALVVTENSTNLTEEEQKEKNEFLGYVRRAADVIFKFFSVDQKRIDASTHDFFSSSAVNQFSKLFEYFLDNNDAALPDSMRSQFKQELKNGITYEQAAAQILNILYESQIELFESIAGSMRGLDKVKAVGSVCMQTCSELNLFIEYEIFQIQQNTEIPTDKKNQQINKLRLTSYLFQGLIHAAQQRYLRENSTIKSTSENIKGFLSGVQGQTCVELCFFLRPGVTTIHLDASVSDELLLDTHEGIDFALLLDPTERTPFPTLVLIDAKGRKIGNQRNERDNFQLTEEHMVHVGQQRVESADLKAAQVLYKKVTGKDSGCQVMKLTIAVPTNQESMHINGALKQEFEELYEDVYLAVMDIHNNKSLNII